MPIDILRAFDEKQPDPDFLWPGFLAGTVGALVAPGATGKSFWALQAAMAVACHVPGGDLLGLNPTQNGRVYYIAGEDPELALTQRLYSMSSHLGIEARESIAKHLVIDSVMGTQLNLINDDQRKTLIEKCRGARLLVIDTLSRVHQLDENSNADMSRLIAAFEDISKATGAAVLFLHHANKMSIREGQGDHQHAARGASSLIDNSRWCAYMSKMTEDESKRLTERAGGAAILGRRAYLVRYGVSKQNYGQTQPEQWFTRADGGVLIPATLHAVEKSSGNREGRARV
ncbi:Regulatory protein RepA [compost metagenome]